jgi:hypothetical protein
MSDDLFLYMHNKGATHITDAAGAFLGRSFAESQAAGPRKLVYGFGRRTMYEMACFHEVVSNWADVLSIFDTHGARIQHAGLAPAVEGHEWYNFFWVRPGYLATRLLPKAPSKSLDRHFYEHWLGNSPDPAAVAAASTAAKEIGDVFPIGCAGSYSLMECKIGACRTAKGPEELMVAARMKLDAAIRLEHKNECTFNSQTRCKVQDASDLHMQL